MNVELTTTWHWFPFAFVAMVGLLTAYAWDEVRTVSRARRLALLVIMLVAAFGFYKSTIVRPHLGFAMGAVGVVLFALARPGTRQQFTFLFAAVVFAFMGISPRDPVVLLNPMPQLRAEAQQAAVLLRPWKWAAAESRTQAQLAAAYGIDPPILAAIGSASVHVDPQDTAVAAAYPELHWLPLPMFQSYSSYTSAMDNLNASVLSGPAAPQRILREAPHPFSARQPAVVTMTIDNRDRWFDGPAGMLQTFCRYDETAATARWEVLALNPTRTCGTPEPLGSVTAPLGSTVSVPTDPRPDRIVIVRVHGIDESPLDRVLSTLYHAPQWFVTINGADRYRLVPGTAVDGLIMSMPTSVVRSAGFAPDQVTSAAVSADTMLPWQGALTFEFLSVPLVGG